MLKIKNLINQPHLTLSIYIFLFAVLYAQVLAEKGFDIVFQGTRQIDQLPGGIPIITNTDSSSAPLETPFPVDHHHEESSLLMHETIKESSPPVFDSTTVTLINTDSVSMDVSDYQPITSLAKQQQPSSNLIQITFDHCELKSSSQSTYLPNGGLSPTPQSTLSTTPPPNLSSPALSMFSPLTTISASTQLLTPPQQQMFTPPRQSPSNKMSPSKKGAAEQGSPIPILIRRADNNIPSNRRPPPLVFPNVLAETDLEGNSLN
jgi:hypothetical protein